MVDDWGRDQRFIDVVGPIARLRWRVMVGGVHHLPSRHGALLVVAPTGRRTESLGDALGAPLEGLKEGHIRQVFGELKIYADSTLAFPDRPGATRNDVFIKLMARSGGA